MSEELVTVRQLSWGYNGRRLFEDLDFSLTRGERCLIAGENGSGKTTFIKILLGILPVREAEITVFGEKLGSPEWLKSRFRAAYVNQETVKSDLPISAREVVELGTLAGGAGSQGRQKLVEAAMERTNSLHLARRPYSVLSGGEKQRVSLARCFAQEAELLFLDEPTASLDPESSRDLVAFIESLDVSAVMITHDEDLLERSGWRTVHLRHGKFRGRP